MPPFTHLDNRIRGVTGTIPRAVERLVVRRDDGAAGAINVNHRPCGGMQGAIMPRGDNETSTTASH